MTSERDAQEFADLAQSLTNAGTVQQTADQVVEQALIALGASYGGITLIRGGGRLETMAPSDDIVVKADLLQYDLREGPCHDASWQGVTLASQDLSADRRWPTWGPQAVALGIGAVLAAELNATETGRRLGALNLYWRESTTFSSDDLAYANIFAVHAAVALANSLRDAQLNTAMDARKVIGQAQGILMERYGLSTEQAFEVLRRYSQDHNVKLRLVAEQLVATRQLPDRTTDDTMPERLIGSPVELGMAGDADSAPSVDGNKLRPDCR